MRNFLKEFIEENGRKPSQDEAIALMNSVIKKEDGRKKFEKSMNGNFNKGALMPNKGGMNRSPKYLSPNCIRINNLMHEGFDHAKIANLLNMRLGSVMSLSKAHRLPRKKEDIINC